MRILFIAPFRYVGTMAFVMESVMAFAESECQVDFLVSAHCDPPLALGLANITILEYESSGSRISNAIPVDAFKKAGNAAGTVGYDWIIGAGEMGLIIAAVVARRYQVPYIYWNLELHTGRERSGVTGLLYGLLLKCFEKKANRRARLTVTQDRMRGRLFVRLNGIRKEALRYIPNSRQGAATRDHGFFMHDLFGFDHDTSILLWIGGLSPGDGALEMAKNAQGWPDNIKLVFHFSGSIHTPYMRAILARHGQGAVYVSQNPVSYAQLPLFIRSARVGFGLYADKGMNARCIGYSSGKVNLFLKHGIPCVVSDFVGLRWVERKGAGVCVSGVRDVLSAVMRINEEYSAYQESAVSVFNETLSFDKAFCALLKEMRGG